MQRTHHPTIGVLAGWQMYDGSLPHSYLAPAYQGIAAAARDYRCNLLMACGINRMPYVPRPAWPGLAASMDFIPVGPWNTAGLIIFPGAMLNEQPEFWADLTASGHPTVCVSRGGLGRTLAIDGASGVIQALDHLLEHDHRQIALLQGKLDVPSDGEERLRAFEHYHQQHGLALDPRLIAEGDFTQLGGELAMQRILQAGVSFSAVLASNDAMAIGALAALQRAGLQVPKDVALIGFDDQLIARAQMPPLTTIRQPIFEMGYRALEWLLEQIHGQTDAHELELFPARLVVRDSCGCGSIKRLQQTELESITQAQVVGQFSQTLLTMTMQLTTNEIQRYAAQLIEALWGSLAAHNEQSFWLALDELLHELDQRENDWDAWQTALDQLEVAVEQSADFSQTQRDLAHSILRRCQLRLSERLRRDGVRGLVQQIHAADTLGMMTTQLTTATTEAQIYQILAEWLPRLGISATHINFYEPRAGDPVAWCRGGSLANGGLSLNYHVASRQFPPAQLLNAEPRQLALLPLIIPDSSNGFVAFETNSLGACAAVVMQLASALRSARLYQQAQEANRLKSRFLSMVSHELCTPLTLMVGLSEMLLAQEQPNPVQSLSDLERIHLSSQHLGRLLRDVLDLASSDYGQLRLEHKPVDLQAVFEVVRLSGEQLAHAKGLNWQADIPTELPQVWGDQTRLAQIALNLISNAVKFTLRGTVRLQVKVADMTIITTISDTGLGIAEADQGLIFDEFRRLDHGHSGGLGLGLAIAKRLVEGHGGTIGLNSTLGVGSDFFFTLPILAPANLNVPQSSELAAFGLPETETNNLPRQILVVDDEALVLDLHVRMLQSRLPHDRIIPAQSGQEALVLMQQLALDLVILDLMMPELDGFAVLDVMRSKESLRQLPVIVLSAQMLTEPAMIRLSQSVTTVLVKGMFNAHEIQAYVEEALSQHPQSSYETRRMVRKAMAWIHANYAEPLTREDLARYVGVSERHLTRCFRTQVGVTPMAYLNRYRVTRAKELLQTTDTSITAIALATGFSDSAHFSHVFQKIAGSSPSAFRRNPVAEPS